MKKSIDAIKVEFTIPMPIGQSLRRYVYCYAVYSKWITLVDTGVQGAQTQIFARVQAAHRRIEEIAAVVLTHSHPDHIGSAAILRAHHPMTVMAHSLERNWIEDVAEQARARPVPGFAKLVAGSIPVDRVLEDADTVDFGEGIEGKILHTPGHSPGGISIHLPAWRTLFTGDAVPLPNDLPIYDDVYTTVRSVKRLMSIPQVETLFSAWHDPIRDPVAVQDAMRTGLDWIQILHRTIREVVRETGPLEPMGLCRQVISRLRLPESAANPLVAKSFASHLPHLDVQDIKTLE